MVLASGHLTSDEIRDLSWQLEKLDVDLVVAPGMVDVAAPRLDVWLVGGQSLIHVEKPQYSGAKRFDKRAFDIAFSLMVLIAAAPVMLAAALAIKLTSAGPVFTYPSVSVSMECRSRMIKFRSMVVDADKKLADIAHLNESDGVLFKSSPRSPGDQCGSFPAALQHRRTSAVLQCAAGSDQRGRSPSAAA